MYKYYRKGWLCLFMFPCITLKYINSSTTIDAFIQLCGLKVTHQTSVPEVQGSILMTGVEFCLLLCMMMMMVMMMMMMLFLLLLLLLLFYFLVQKPKCVMKCHYFFCSIILFTILSIMRMCGPIYTAHQKLLHSRSVFLIF